MKQEEGRRLNSNFKAKRRKQKSDIPGVKESREKKLKERGL
jgi:hypothetical protein